MRTTIELPDELFHELEAVAVSRRTSLDSVIRAAMEEAIRRTEGKLGRRLMFPLLSSQEPGSVNLTNADIDDLPA